MTFDLEEALIAYPLPEDVEDRVVNRKQVADGLRVSENMISRYLDQGLPCLTRGSNGTSYEFQLSECYAWKRWRDEELRKEREAGDRAVAQLALAFRGSDPEEADAGKVLSAKEIIEESRADYERNRAAELRGELVRAARVRDLFEDVLIEFRTQVVSLVDFAEMEFALSPDQVQKLQRRVDGSLVQARQNFAKTMPGEHCDIVAHVPLAQTAGD